MRQEHSFLNTILLAFRVQGLPHEANNSVVRLRATRVLRADAMDSASWVDSFSPFHTSHPALRESADGPRRLLFAIRSHRKLAHPCLSPPRLMSAARDHPYTGRSSHRRINSTAISSSACEEGMQPLHSSLTIWYGRFPMIASGKLVCLCPSG